MTILSQGHAVLAKKEIWNTDSTSYYSLPDNGQFFGYFPQLGPHLDLLRIVYVSDFRRICDTC